MWICDVERIQLSKLANLGLKEKCIESDLPKISVNKLLGCGVDVSSIVKVESSTLYQVDAIIPSNFKKSFTFLQQDNFR